MAVRIFLRNPPLSNKQQRFKYSNLDVAGRLQHQGSYISIKFFIASPASIAATIGAKLRR